MMTKLEACAFQQFDGYVTHTCDTCHEPFMDGWIGTTDLQTYILCAPCMAALTSSPSDVEAR